MEVFIGVIWLILSLLVLVKSADYFTDNSEKLGKIFGISPFIIGITIIAVGTSLPELASSAVALYKNASAIIPANVIGSNIANILLVIGLSAVFAKTVMESKNPINDDDSTLLLGATALICLIAIDLKITFIESIFLLLGYIVYMFYSLQSRDKNQKKSETELFKWSIPIIILVSTVFIYLGAENTIDSLLYLSTLLGISESVISLTVIALGTSLPEVIVSVIASKKGKYDIAFGNIIGSNMFNILLIPGLLGLFDTIIVSTETLKVGLPFLLIATFIFIFALYDNKIKKGEGMMFLLIYVFFIYSLYL